MLLHSWFRIIYFQPRISLVVFKMIVRQVVFKKNSFEKLINCCDKQIYGKSIKLKTHQKSQLDSSISHPLFVFELLSGGLFQKCFSSFIIKQFVLFVWFIFVRPRKKRIKYNVPILFRLLLRLLPSRSQSLGHHHRFPSHHRVLQSGPHGLLRICSHLHHHE